MTNYTLNNHLRYSIGGREFGYRENASEKFSVQLGTIDFDHYQRSNYCSELRRTADSVYNEFGKDLVIFLSGGTDSEIVLRNFLDIGIKPKCAAVRFKDDYNAPDILEAIEIAKDLSIDLEILDFDVKDFYYSGAAAEFGKTIQCTQVTYLLVYYHILKLGMPSVMGGEALFTRGVSKLGTDWYYTFRENEDASAMRFSEKYNIPLVNEWFSYTPELLMYYLEDETMQNLFSERYNYKLSSVSTKNNVLRRLYPGLRVKKKTHGFERLLGFNYEAYKGISLDQTKRFEPSLDGISLKTVIKMLNGEYES
jgi:hypothetical protein